MTVNCWCSVTKVRTVIPEATAWTNPDLENILVTLYKNSEVSVDYRTSMKYTRLEHLDYNYEITIDNPSKSKKKVIVRLWLGLSSDVTDIR